MIIGIVKEPEEESRVAMLPEAVKILKSWNVEVIVETGAGKKAFAEDALYEDSGAEIVDRINLLKKANIVCGIQALPIAEIREMDPKSVLMGQFNALYNPELTHFLINENRTAFSMELVPRTTRAQSMDVLSSMATVVGYKAVLMAANLLPRFFPMFMTAAGTITPSRVLILGAGVAGLQAIATAKRLGSTVFAFDVRKAAKEEVMSLGAKFVEVEGATDDKSAGGYAVEQNEDFINRQKEAIHEQAIKADVVITTAQIPGKKAPLLIEERTVHSMKPGAVVIDLAASSGGNCALTQAEKTISINGVSIVGVGNLAGQLPQDASKMYGKNYLNFLKLIIKDGQMNLNFEDDIVAGTCVCHEGKPVNSRITQMINN